MIYSVVITPNFLESVLNNNNIIEALHEFYLKHSDDSFKEVLFLLINKKLNYIDKYKKLSFSHGAKNIKLKVFIEDFILRLKRENTENNFNELNVDIFLNTISDLKKVPKIKSQPYLNFPITEDKLEKELKKLCQFGKKFIIFDPYIAQHMTNFSKIGIYEIKNILKSKSLENKLFQIKINSNQGYKHSIRKILQIIQDGSISNKIDIQVLSTIRKDDKRRFEDLISNLTNKIENIKKEQVSNKNYQNEILNFYNHYYNSIIQELYDSNKNPIVASKIKKVISKCFTDLKNQKNQINFELKKEFMDENKFYKRGILIKGDQINVVVDFGQGLNFYMSEKPKKTFINNKNLKKKIKSLKLTKNPEYHLKVITNKNEKSKYSYIEKFENYEENSPKLMLNS
ncbi:hypothetical protein [Candidatus Pelagibacter sp.]|uniref:hypothetical protein n=1 Tax=Candidatus Pelagibacter sp. TaxID=2024849 RepID=UPI003F848A88